MPQRIHARREAPRTTSKRHSDEFSIRGRRSRSPSGRGSTQRPGRAYAGRGEVRLKLNTRRRSTETRDGPGNGEDPDGGETNRADCRPEEILDQKRRRTPVAPISQGPGFADKPHYVNLKWKRPKRDSTPTEVLICQVPLGARRVPSVTGRLQRSPRTCGPRRREPCRKSPSPPGCVSRHRAHNSRAT